MNVIASVLKSVKKDSNGFDDIQSFWTATEKLSFPLGPHVKKSLHKVATPLPNARQESTPRQEFNYDTSSTITDDEEEVEEDSDRPSGSDHDDHDADEGGSMVNTTIRTDTSARSRSKVDTPSGTVYSSLNPSLRSINLSPEDSETSRQSDIDTTLQSSVLPKSSRYSSASSRRDTIESSVPSSSRRSSTAASSRRSSTVVHSDEDEEFDRSTEQQHESGFDADRSNDMNDTTFNGSKSGRLSNASSRSATSAVNSTAGTATPANSRLSRPSTGENSLLLTAPSAGSGTKGGSGKRVSFSGGLGGGLSPISGDASQPPTESSKRTNKSRSSFVSSVASGSADRSRSSAVQSSVQDSNRDDGFDDNDAGDFGDGYDDYPVDDSQRMMSQTDTPLTNSKSISRSGNGTGMDSALRTPYSEQDEDQDGSTSDLRLASGGRDRSRRISIPTPGSRDFVRGTAVSDETYVEEGSSEEAEMETDEEADTSAVVTPAAGRRGRKHGDLDSSTITDGSSFLDNSYLHTIHTSNKKYAEGRKALQEKIPAAFEHKRSVKHKLYSSDEEEDNLQDTSEESGEEGQHLRRSRRATKGRRFAFWKGERPLYEEGTMVGVAEVEPTPAKKRRGNSNAARNKRGARRGGDGEEGVKEEEETEPLPPAELPTHVKYIPRAECHELLVWDEIATTNTVAQVVTPVEAMLPGSELPVTSKRKPGKQGTATAAHAFNVPEVPELYSGAIVGFMELAPQAIKDAENVGKHMQFFSVSRCQPQALELAIAHPDSMIYFPKSAQHVLLREGDIFYIPPGNTYRLENHSTKATAKLFWTIVRPLEAPPGTGADGEAAEDASAWPGSDSTVLPGTHVLHTGGDERGAVMEDDM